METNRLSGRYIICNNAISHTDMLQTINENFPDITLPTKVISNRMAKFVCSLDTKSVRNEYLMTHLGNIPNINNLRSYEAGMVLRPAKQTIVDTCRYVCMIIIIIDYYCLFIDYLFIYLFIHSFIHSFIC